MLGSMFSCGLILHYKFSGMISNGTAYACLKNLLSIYLPLLGIMCGFYFSLRNNDSSERSANCNREKFAAAILFIGPISILPFIIIFFYDTVDGAFKLIDTYKMYGQTVCSAAITYYFADIKISTD